MSGFFNLSRKGISMAQIQPVIRIEIDPSEPVSEICQVITAVIPYHPNHEEAILHGVKEAINKRLNQLKGDDEGGKPIRESSRN